MNDLPPYVERELETSYQDSTVDFPSTVSECMLAMVGVQALVFVWFVIRWIVLVEPLPSLQSVITMVSDVE